MLKKTFFLLSFCLMLSFSIIFAQEKEIVVEAEKPKTEEPKPVEPKRESETRSNDTSSRRDPSPPRNENQSRSENSNSERNKTPKDRDNNFEERESNKRRKDSDNVDQVSRPKRPERPPVENSNPRRPNIPPVEKPPINHPNPPVDNPDNPPVNLNSSQVDNNNQGRNKDKDRDDKDKDDKKRHRNNGGWSGYPYPTNYPTSVPSSPAPFSMRDYFDKDDVFFDVYDSYVEKPEKYLPFFEDSPGIAFQPLYYSYGRKFFNNEFPWVSNSWTIYYEPDLDDIFVDFTTLGNVKYERMVLYPIGDTIKKVNKKFEYKGSDLRPVLVEKIPNIEQDKVYSFNVHDLPKGDYEIRFIAGNGATVKHLIRLK